MGNNLSLNKERSVKGSVKRLSRQFLAYKEAATISIYSNGFNISKRKSSNA